MTKEEAIARLEMRFQECSFPQKRCKGDCCTCSKAIDALQAEIKKHQLEVGAVADGIVGYETIKKSAERYKTKPSDLISRADAIKAVYRKYPYNAEQNKCDEMVDALKALPSADAVPQLKQTDTLIIADALRYLAKDTERHLVDRTRADALRQQFLKYGASMCKGGDDK